ncbi:phosphopantetheine-binding protein [Aeromicrobium sp. CTD01-1L150]|uniref:phosphopantetheine-binding protein n=1 Tax=Aeromicrobium sp. CTD01-1L150 TaxID=3341830 RepID=UPI0035C0CEE0
MTTPEDVDRVVRTFLQEAAKLSDDFEATTPLYADGAGLDSLETAELSAILEDEFGSDPYSAGDMPQTVAEIQAFYAGVPQS